MSDNTRTKEQGLLDIDYSIRLYELHARFYRRAKTFSAFISLISGTAVVATVLNKNQELAIAFSALLALLPIIDVLVNPSAKTEFFDSYRKRFCELKARMVRADCTISQIDQELAQLYAEPCDEIEPLRRIALHNNMTTHGYPEIATPPLTRYERLWAILA